MSFEVICELAPRITAIAQKNGSGCAEGQDMADCFSRKKGSAIDSEV